MLEEVEWGTFKLGDLFEIENTSSFNKDMLTVGTDYDYVTRTSQNQGVLQTTGFVNEENINAAGTWSLGLLQMDFFYRRKPWYAGQFVRKITPKVRFTEKSALWMTAVLNKQKGILKSVLVRNVNDKFKSIDIKLPIKDSKIDFGLMERLMAELEATALLELDNYLSVAGLKCCQLTPEEQRALMSFGSIEWREYKLGTLLDRVRTKKLPYKADELPKRREGQYTLPCLTSSFNNQGLNYFSPRDGATILKNVISIPSNSDVYRAYFQPNEFTVLSDAYALRWVFNEVELTPNQYLFVVQCINKVTDLPIYSYKNKLGGWNVVKQKTISLPVRNDSIDYEFMELLVSALKKLSIEDLVLYNKQKLASINRE